MDAFWPDGQAPRPWGASIPFSCLGGPSRRGASPPAHLPRFPRDFDESAGVVLMGGMGSGRRPRHPGTLADCPALRVGEVPRTVLEEAFAAAWGDTAWVTRGEEELAVVTRPQPLGGRRVWWQCLGCRRPCAILYRPRAAIPSWRCHRCVGLPYPSQREGKEARANRRLRRLAGRLRHPCPWLVSVMDGELPPKPRGMHHRTYARLAERWDATEEAAAAAWLERAMRLVFR